MSPDNNSLSIATPQASKPTSWMPCEAVLEMRPFASAYGAYEPYCAPTSELMLSDDTFVLQMRISFLEPETWRTTPLLLFFKEQVEHLRQRQTHQGQ